MGKGVLFRVVYLGWEKVSCLEWYTWGGKRCHHTSTTRKEVTFTFGNGWPYTRGQKILTFGSRGDSPHHMNGPKGMATDDSDNIYVSSEHKLQKFTSTGELNKCVGRDGGKEGEFDDPRGLTLCDNLVGKGVLFGGVLIERGSIYILSVVDHVMIT